jgi:predicted RNA-binding Zn-ribbon protein involved in translation (DUF1610 family)
MDITFSCTNCGQNLEINENGAGASIDCPKCGKPVYVPSRAAKVTQEEPVRVAVRPVQRSTPSNAEHEKLTSAPPYIEGGLHCVFIGAVLMVIGLFLFRMGLVAGMICYALAIPFQIGALLCGVHGICRGSIKHGLGLLAGVSVLCALIVFGPLWGIAKMSAITAPMMEDWLQHMQEMMKQYQR